MYAQVTRFQDDLQDLEDGLSHVIDQVIPAARASAGARGIWARRPRDRRATVDPRLRERGRCDRALLRGGRAARCRSRAKPSGAGSTRYEIYAETLDPAT